MAYKPQWVSIMIGINDVWRCFDAMRKMMDQYGKVCEKLATYYQLKFIDLQAEFDKLLQSIHPMEICWDRIHPNMIGHTLIAHSFLKSINAK